ncbi:MAG: methionine--tRNA ligase, partial [bacterium]|nr:methionine--tRNA ligase [bacterium]
MEENNEEVAPEIINQITIDDFAKVRMQIGTILSAEKIPEGDKLLKLEIDFGEEKRQIIAGMAEFIEDPATLVGRQMPFVTNLKPRKLKGYESQGMTLAVSTDEG